MLKVVGIIVIIAIVFFMISDIQNLLEEVNIYIPLAIHVNYEKKLFHLRTVFDMD